MTTVEEEPDQSRQNEGGRVARSWVLAIAVLLLAVTVAALAWGAAQRSDASALRTTATGSARPPWLRASSSRTC
jgi:hypothetical protein